MFKSSLPLKYTNPFCPFIGYIHHIPFIKVNIYREKYLPFCFTILAESGNFLATRIVDDYSPERINKPKQAILIYLCCCGKAKRASLILKPFKCHDKIPLFIIYMNSTTAKRCYKINPVL